MFDPHSREGRGRVRWQVYRRVARRGLLLVLATDADRVASRELRCFVREIGEGASLRVRIATGTRGNVLAPTDAEAAEARAEKERARADRAEVEVARLRAELARRGAAARAPRRR